jgi:DNA-binding MarR family transcriptional regulator
MMYDLQFSDITLTTWALLRQTWSVMDKAAETRLAKVGLTPEKVAVLWICRDYPGLLTTAEISRFLSRQSQSVTGLLNRMEEEGLVARTPKRKGRPFTEVKMTEKGQKAAQIGIAIIRVLVSETTPVLSTEDQQQLHKYLKMLRQQMVEGLHLELTPPLDIQEREPISVRW